MIFFPNLLGQLGNMELRGSYGKISKFGDLKSKLKWYMEGVWGIFVNKSLGFQIQFNMALDFKRDLIHPLDLKIYSNIALSL